MLAESSKVLLLLFSYFVVYLEYRANIKYKEDYIAKYKI